LLSKITLIFISGLFWKAIFYYNLLPACKNGVTGYPWPEDGRDYSGYTNMCSPKRWITNSYKHTFQLGVMGALVPHIDLQYKMKYVFNYTGRSYMLSYQESYYIVNGSFTFTHSSGKWTFNAYVKNATTNYAAKNF